MAPILHGTVLVSDDQSMQSLRLARPSSSASHDPHRRSDTNEYRLAQGGVGDGLVEAICEIVPQRLRDHNLCTNRFQNDPEWHRVCILYRRRRRWISSDVPGIYTKPYVSRYTAAPRERRAALTQSHWEMMTPSRRLSPVSDTGSTGLTRAASEPPRPNHFTGCDSDSAATGSRIIPSV